MWQSLEDYHDKSAHQREVVSSVLQGDANKYTIDAKDIVFQVHNSIIIEVVDII